MKLLMLTRKVDRGDALAGFTYAWVQAFAQQVDELQIICLEKGDTAGLPENCHVYSLGKEEGKGRLSEFIRFQKLAQNLVPQVDGIFSHQNPEYGILIAPWAKLHHRRLVAWYTHKAVTWKLQLLTALADRLVTASAESFRLPTKKLTILSHGIDTDFFTQRAQRSSARKVLLSVSRLSPSKHIEQMIDLFVTLQHSMNVELRLRIVGTPARPSDHAYTEALRSRVSKLGLDQFVEFKVAKPYRELPDEYHQADLFLNFSSTGSLDKAVLEAMSCGVPVVTTNEAFRDMCNSLDPRMYSADNATIIAQQAEALLSADTRDLSSKLHAYVAKEHSLTNLVKTILSLYA